MFDISQPAYITLRELITERTNSIVAWVGSGISANAGLPTWNKLKKILIEGLRKKASSFEASETAKLLDIANKIEIETNYWIAFQRLKENLGNATYEDLIKEALRPASTAPVPQIYKYLWNLRIHGLLNLNIDRLATKAFTQVNTQRNIVEFDGKDAGNLTYVLKSPEPFIANLHGNMDNSASWIFTRSELSWITKNEAYLSFIRSCVSSNTILFLGVSADDISVGGHLEKLSQIGIKTGSNFWVTDRCDAKLDHWAEKIGIRMIRYSSNGENHSALDELFRDLLTYVPPEDKNAPPVAPENVKIRDESFPSPVEILSNDSETIRQALNSHAIELLSKGNNSIEEYERFCQAYDEAIYRAWYLSTSPGKNKLLGYTLVKEVTQGAFGKVYKAIDEEGKDIAVKVLLEDVRHDIDLLQCFRRGVKSMRILAENKVNGMVAYKDASEIPALVVMDWIEGPNLGDAVQSGQIDDWPTLLRIADELADIIRRAHQIPERVLHRDLRPSNIMLDGFYMDPDGWKVVVLDFDLSWHRGAIEKSLMHSAGILGYLAPEQIARISGVSTRHSAVDSFGIGMTLFYMVSKVDPIVSQHQHKDWEDMVYKSTSKKTCSVWKSIPKRYARIILKATRNKQSERWDMSQIQGELERLREAVNYPSQVSSAEMVAEEIAARCDCISNYSWDFDKSLAFIESPSGLTIKLGGNEAQRKIEIEISWENRGYDNWQKISKYLPDRFSAAKELLKKENWHIDSESKAARTFSIRSSLDISNTNRNMEEITSCIQRACSHFNF